MNKRIILLLTTFFSAPVFGLSDCSKTTQELITKATPARMQQVIDSYKNAVFGMGNDSLIKAGYDEKAFETWEDLLECAHEWIKEQVNQKKSPAHYKTAITNLRMVNEFLKIKIPQLKTKYALIIEKKNKKTGTIDIDANKLKIFSSIDVAQLADLEKNLEKYSGLANTINATALSTILNNTPVPTSWTGNIEKNPAKILPNYQTFFKSYSNIKTALNHDPDKFLYFLQTQNIPLHDSIDAAIVMEQMEQFIFIKKNAKEAQEVLNRIREIYPKILSNKEVGQLVATQDKASMIIYSEAEVLALICDRLLQEVHQLVQAMKK